MFPMYQPPEWVELETEVARILTKQELHGWCFDERYAWEIAQTLRAEQRGTEE